jgi:hypothetical protein
VNRGEEEREEKTETLVDLDSSKEGKKEVGGKKRALSFSPSPVSSKSSGVETSRECS